MTRFKFRAIMAERRYAKMLGLSGHKDHMTKEAIKILQEMRQ